MHWTSRERRTERGEVELLHALLALAEQLQSNLDLDAVVRVIATAASETFGFGEASVLVREKGETLRVHAAVGGAASLAPGLLSAPIPVTALERLLGGHQRVGPGYFVPGDDPAWQTSGLAALASMEAKDRHEGWSDGDTLFIPFSDDGGSLIGVLRLGSPQNDSRPRQETLGSLGLFATYAAAALVNAREHQELREVTRELAEQLRIRHEVAEMSNVLLSSLDQQLVFEKSAQALQGLVPFDSFGIALREEGAEPMQLGPVFAVPDPPPEPISGILIGRDPLSAAVIASGEMLVAGGEALGVGAHRFEAATDEVGTVVVAPLKAGRDVTGLIVIGRRRSRFFSDREIELVQLFINIATIAVHNARMYQEVQHLAISDGLTGVHNYRHFREALASEVSRADRYGESFCLLMMDLDHFKAVNDTVGHQQGDEVLKAVTAVLRHCSRESDYLARYGGEEFVMILPRTPLREARTVAERIRRNVREIDAGSPALRVSMSIGVAAYPDSCADMDAVLRNADAALLRAKSTGRNRVHLHGELDDGIEIVDERSVTLARRFGTVAGLNEAESAGLVGAISASALIARPAPQELAPAVRMLPRASSLAASSGPGRMASIALLYGTENWDGSGYPEGLSGEEIPRVARAYAVCREYLRAEQSEPQAAIHRLRERAGNTLDPRLVQQLTLALADGDEARSMTGR